MSETIIIAAEKFVDINGVKSGQIIFENGVIEGVGKVFGPPDYTFGKEFLVFPGFIDQHVHLRYGQPEKEDPVTGTLAAINGGVTRVMDMPNNPVDIAPLTKETLEDKIEWGKNGLIPIHHYAATRPGSKPIPGVEHYKVFIGKSVGDLWFETEEQLIETLSAYRGKNITFHCELQSEINSSAKNHWSRRPVSAEIKAAEIAERLCHKYNINGNIAHATTREAFTKDMLVEATFHHMLLHQEDSPFSQTNPPIRSYDRRRILIAEAKDPAGNIDFIASDHAPHMLNEKLGDNPPSGQPMLDTYGNCAGYLINEYKFSPQRIAELCSYGPASWIGVNAGQFKVGYEASFTVLNMRKNIRMDRLPIYSKAGCTPFKDFKMPEVTATIAQGRALKLEGKVFC